MKRITKLLRWVLLFFIGGHADIVLAQCQGLDFTSSPATHTCVPGIVNFTASGFPTGSSFTWKFGTTQVNGADTISYIFTDKGTYDIEMTVQTPSSNVCTVTKPSYLFVHQPDTPVIFASKTLLCDGPDSVRLKNTTPGYSRVDWIIDANNLTNKGDSFTYQFIFPGIKNVGVRAFDSYGCSVFKNFDSVVKVYYPLNITLLPSKTAGCKPLKVNYTANISPASRTITQYSWQFQGATPSTSTAAAPQNITYNTPGVFDVTLTVKTADGCTYTKVTTFQFDPVDTTPPPFFASDSVFCQKTFIKLKNVSDRSVYPGRFWWDLGSGGSIDMMTDTALLPYDTVIVRYNDPGLYSPTLYYYYKGCNVKNTRINYINSVEANNQFQSQDNLACEVPTTVHFTNTSQVLAGKKFTYVFYAADGRTILDSTNDLNPYHTYTTEGEYNVQLITRSPGCEQKLTFAKYVRIKKPEAQMNYTGEICFDEELIMNSATPKFTNDTIKYKWYIWKKDSSGVLYYSDTETVKYVFRDTGYFDVTFIIYSQHCADTLKKDSAIHVYKIIAGLKNFAPFYCSGSQIYIKGLQNTSPKDLVTYHDYLVWHQQDSLISNTGGHNVDFLGVTEPGLYNIRYIASNHGVCPDTIIKKGEIKISAADAEVKASKTYGCLPFTTTLRANILYNYHFSSPDSSLTYQWEVRRQDSLVKDTTIVKFNGTDSVCNLTIFKPDIYDIGLKVTNKDNCNKYVYYPKLINLMHFADVNIPADACRGTTITAKNNSVGMYEKFKWIVDKPIIRFEPSDSAFEPEMVFLDSGMVRVVLEAYDSAGCVDRDTAIVSITQLDVSFATPDTFKKCAPSIVEFTVQAPLATYMRWSFGDGDTVETYGKDIFHIYRTNSGSATDGFDVYLYAQSPTGCVSEVLKKDYVKVVGPVPKFDIVDHSGCEPFQVHFVNQSQNLQGLYFDFGDGSPIDSGGFSAAHTYTIKNPALVQDVFRPKLLAYDKDFCFSVYQSTDSVVVYRKPEAGFVRDYAVVCQGDPVTLTDTTQLATKHFWDFDANGSIDDTLQVTTQVFVPGNHDVQLRILTAKGCADTVTYPAFVHVNPTPLPNFAASDTAFCLNRTIGFFNATPGANRMQSFAWDFGDVNADDTSSVRSPYYRYHSLGFKTITLIATDSNNCTDTLVKLNAVEVIDTNIAIQPVMSLVTVANDNSVFIEWDSVTIRKFKNYNLYRSVNGSGNWQAIYQPLSPVDTTYTDYSYLAKDTSVAYQVSVSNQCGVESKPALPHATIHTRASSQKHAIMHVDWNPYQGWPVKEYRLFSAINPKINPYKQIAVLTSPGYNDSNLCAIEKFYYVQAISASDTNMFSFSNIASHTVVYDTPSFAPVLTRATVEKDRQVQVIWTDQNQKKWRGFYEIDRYDTVAGWKIPFDSTYSFSYTDHKTDVHNEQYIYRVRFKDTCSAEAPEGNIGTTILLKARIKNDEPYLTWTPYKDWPTGVDHYLVQINRNGMYHTLRKVSGDTLFFTDHDLHPSIDSIWIYRVIGVSKWFADTSVSNTATATPFSRMWIPNAFTPNEDGLNDIWLPVAVGVYNESDHPSLQYELRIFDRWGTEVFRSENLFIGWDGNFRGAPCADGVYTYSIRAAGMSDRQKFNKSGTISLMH